jgi:asparagine N-glycosylation enzyme membrane subunit Stt3
MREKILPLTALGESWSEPGPFFCYSGQMSSAVKIFERVRGANVSGEVAPLAKVKIELDLFSPFTGRRFTYRQSATADAEGQVTFTLPYAGGLSDGSAPHPLHQQRVHATGPYRLLVEGRDPVAIDVPDEAVLSGADLSLPAAAAASQ